MNIILNGSVFIKGEEVYFEDFEIEVEEDLSFDCLTDDEEDCCDGDDEDESEYIDYYIHEGDEDYVYEKGYIDLLNKYVDIIQSEQICPDCLRAVLDTMIDEFKEEWE